MMHALQTPKPQGGGGDFGGGGGGGDFSGGNGSGSFANGGGGNW